MGAIGDVRHFVIGANEMSSTAAVRDRLFVGEDLTAEFLDRLRGGGLNQAVLLSTCARTEVQGVHDDPEAATHHVTDIFARHAGVNVEDLVPQLYAKEDEDAVRHIFAVVSALDSPVIGEPQVAGQVRECHRLARAAGMVGPELDLVLGAAYSTAKRVRTETSVGERPVSMAAAAVDLARNVHGDLSRCSALMIVAGDMGELIVERLLAAGLGRLVVTSTVDARAKMAARRYTCHHAPIDKLGALIADADIVVSSLGTGEYTISADVVSAALAARRQKPIFLVDAAIPGDIHPGVDGLDGAFRYDLDDLERVAMQGRASRDAAAAEAYEIVDTEVEGFFRRVAGRSAAPVVSAMRSHFEAVRAEVLAEKAGASADEATRLLINRLLHHPSRTLRTMAEQDEADKGATERLLRRLFRLGGGKD